MSEQAIEHCTKRVAGGTLPGTTSSPKKPIASPDVEVVIICSVNAFHPTRAILALQHSKYMFVEKPFVFNYRELEATIAAEKTSGRESSWDTNDDTLKRSVMPWKKLETWTR